MSAVTRGIAAALAAASMLAGAQVARATVVGDIRACYKCSQNFGGFGLFDGVTFLFENTSSSDIINGVFTAQVGDPLQGSFSIGTIPAGGSVIIIPTISDDGVNQGLFWDRTNGAGPDTSDKYATTGGIQFEFTGSLGGIGVDSGIFTPSQTAGPSNDGAIALIDFLGGGLAPDDDDLCTDCFGPKVIATLGTTGSPASPIRSPVSPIPEPASLAIFGTALAGLGLIRRRRQA